MVGQHEFKTISDMENYFYAGAAQYLQKADDPVLSSTASVYNAVYGAKVWVNLNMEANPFGIHPKEPWGRHSGVRVLKSRSYSLLADVPNIQEDGTLPDTRKPALDSYTIKPVNVVDNFDVSETQQFLGGVDDSLGDTLGTYREYFAREHAERMSRQFVRRVKDYSSSNRFITSIDQIISAKVECDESTITDANVDVFGLDRHTAAGPFDSYVDNNAGTARTYSNSLLDTAFTNLWVAGARPKVILTGYKTWQKIKADTVGVSAGTSDMIRFIDPSSIKSVSPGVNGIQSVAAGQEGALQVATYNGVPILQSKDVKAELSVTEADPIYIEDLDYIKLRIAKPTQYFENGILSGDPFVVNRLGQEGMYRTMLESFCTWFAVQGKITRLSA